jgi:hypothetical protein
MSDFSATLAKASESFKRANPGLFPEYAATTDTHHRPQGSQPQQALCHAPDGTPSGEAFYSGRVRISVTSVRKRLIDPDNLCPKYIIDACRYSGLIRDDTESAVEISTSQRRCEKGEAEHTELTITPIQ